MNLKSKKFLLILAILLIAIVLIYLIVRAPKEKKPATLPPPAEETNIVQGSLSPDKEKIRQGLIAPLGDQPGAITDGPDYRVSYLPAGPVFQIEIKITNITKAKDAAIQFFKNKGFSEEDICKLPVAFYLGSGPSHELQGSGVTVKPKPDFCP